MIVRLEFGKKQQSSKYVTDKLTEEFTEWLKHINVIECLSIADGHLTRLSYLYNQLV